MSSSGLLTFFMPDLGGGGAQRVMLGIAAGLARRGHPVALAVCDLQGELLEQVPSNVEMVVLEAAPMWLARGYALKADPGAFGVLLGPVLLALDPSPTLRYVPALARFLARRQPHVLFAAAPYMNVEAVLARRSAGTPTRLVLTEHNNLAHGHPFGLGRHRRQLPPLLRRMYVDAYAIVAVSEGVAEDIAQRTGISADRITTIYNPVVPDNLDALAAAPVDHPWFLPEQPPIVLGVGRLSRAKDFWTLIRAFAIVRRRRQARLVILGSLKTPRKTGKRQAEFMALARELGVADDLSLPGFAPNPLAYMSRARVFVLSSRHEGFGNVLAEALACGCPAVSTDCPSGPAEILENGEYGPLVPVGDGEALAAAIERVLDSPLDTEKLRRRGASFSVERAVDRYEALMAGSG